MKRSGLILSLVTSLTILSSCDFGVRSSIFGIPLVMMNIRSTCIKLTFTEENNDNYVTYFLV